jgi:hypothetical protein
MSTTPTLGAVLERRMRAAAERLRTGRPGRVTSYDEATGKASVQSLIKEAFVDQDGTRRVALPPIINGVPVILPGSGGVRVRFPISVGDTVWLCHSDRSIDRWLARGGEVDPEDDRMHALDDAVAYPGLLDFAHAGNAATLIEFTGTEIRIGTATGHQPTIRGTAYRAAEDTLLAALSALAAALAAPPMTAPQQAAATALGTAITTFQAASATYLTTTTKVT